MSKSQARPGRGLRSRVWHFTRWILLTVLVLAVALTVASFGFNLVTDGASPRPPGLLMASGSVGRTRLLSIENFAQSPR